MQPYILSKWCMGTSGPGKGVFSTSARAEVQRCHLAWRQARVQLPKPVQSYEKSANLKQSIAPLYRVGQWAWLLTQYISLRVKNKNLWLPRLLHIHPTFYVSQLKPEAMSTRMPLPDLCQPWVSERPWNCLWTKDWILIYIWKLILTDNLVLTPAWIIGPEFCLPVCLPVSACLSVYTRHPNITLTLSAILDLLRTDSPDLSSSMTSLLFSEFHWPRYWQVSTIVRERNCHILKTSSNLYLLCLDHCCYHLHRLKLHPADSIFHNLLFNKPFVFFTPGVMSEFQRVLKTQL